jgi:hypothetical protein
MLITLVMPDDATLELDLPGIPSKDDELSLIADGVTEATVYTVSRVRWDADAGRIFVKLEAASGGGGKKPKPEKKPHPWKT